MESSKILVVMPLYNARAYVRKAMESILAQSYPNFILLVINDGSTDGSELEAGLFQDSRVILWHQENQGPGAIMNRAIQYASDLHIPFIARMDADDISSQLRLETQIRLFDKYPAVAACSANSYYIDANSEQIIGSSTVSISPGLIRWEITHGLRGLIQGACVFRTEALLAINGYRSEFNNAEEADVFLRLADHYELRNCSEFLYNIRIHTDSLSIQNVRQNVLYNFYALDCAKNRKNGKPERGFDEFNKTMPWVMKFKIRREVSVLDLWRAHIYGYRLPALLLASLLDPRRVIIRVLRRLDINNV